MRASRMIEHENHDRIRCFGKVDNKSRFTDYGADDIELVDEIEAVDRDSRKQLQAMPTITFENQQNSWYANFCTLRKHGVFYAIVL